MLHHSSWIVGLVLAAILPTGTSQLQAEPPATSAMTSDDIDARQQAIIGKPPRLKPLADDELSPQARAITAKLRTAAGLPPSSDIPEMVATLLRHPSLYEKEVALGAELLGRGTLAPRHRELAVLRTGWLCGAPYEWGEHVAIGKRAGLNEADIARVVVGSKADGWTQEDRAVVRAAEELHNTAMITDETWEILASFLDERQLIELPYVIGNYTKVAFLQNALRFRLQSPNPGLTAR